MTGMELAWSTPPPDTGFYVGRKKRYECTGDFATVIVKMPTIT